MTHEFTVSGGKMRLDVFLSKEGKLSRSHAKKLVDEGSVTVNGRQEKASFTVSDGDKVVAVIAPPKPLDVRPVDIPIDIIYQDDDLAVINKPQGLTVHAGCGTDENTLVNALLYRLDKLSGINGVVRPGIVHRIDKDTSGILLVAKNDKAHLSLAEQIEKKTCKRCYYALLHGNLKEDSGRIDSLIDRSPKDRTAFAVSKTKGKRAVTDYTVVKRYGDYTLAEFSLLTGRTHQIRVHAKHLGHPVVGDPVYGPKKQPFKLNGQLLHAYKITFTHPTTGEQTTFYAPLPDYFDETLKKLERKQTNK